MRGISYDVRKFVTVENRVERQISQANSSKRLVPPTQSDEGTLHFSFGTKALRSGRALMKESVRDLPRPVPPVPVVAHDMRNELADLILRA